jgi:hypothetical protein
MGMNITPFSSLTPTYLPTYLPTCSSLQVAALAPKVEAMEASWNRIRTISGAETAEDVITYWEGLKAKEEQVRETGCG